MLKVCDFLLASGEQSVPIWSPTNWLVHLAVHGILKNCLQILSSRTSIPFLILITQFSYSYHCLSYTELVVSEIYFMFLSKFVIAFFLRTDLLFNSLIHFQLYSWTQRNKTFYNHYFFTISSISVNMQVDMKLLFFFHF